MKNFIKITQLVLLLILLSSCKKALKNKKFIKNSENQKSEQFIKVKNKMDVRYSCGEDGITEFLNSGWVIIDEYREEKICTWKSVAASKDCDMGKDKGCKITVPDKIGQEKVYLLER